MKARVEATRKIMTGVFVAALNYTVIPPRCEAPNNDLSNDATSALSLSERTQNTGLVKNRLSAKCVQENSSSRSEEHSSVRSREVQTRTVIDTRWSCWMHELHTALSSNDIDVPWPILLSLKHVEYHCSDKKFKKYHG